MHTSFDPSTPDSASQSTIQGLPPQPPLLPYTISEERKQEFLKHERKDAIMMCLGCFGVCAVVIFLIWLVTFKLGYIVYGGITILVIAGLLSPIFGIVNLVTTNVAISKGDYEFYEGVVAFQNEKGYRVYSLSADNLHFIDDVKTLGEVAPGGKVVVAKLHNDYSLMHHENQ